jgi:transcriptional regulator with XRE-family HTH domain
MSANISPEVRRRRLAAELRRLRFLSGMTNDEVAVRLGWSPSKVSRYELARTGLKPADVRKMLEIYGVDTSRQDELLALAEEAKEKGWWESYSDVLSDEQISLIGLEDEAAAEWSWHVEVIPGLLQTQAYARQVNAKGYSLGPVPPSQIERSVRLRMRRQELLTRQPPLELVAVLDESVLLRKFGDAAVMRGQLAHLVEVARLPNVTIRVMRLGQDWPMVLGSFEIFRYGSQEATTLPDVVYVEHLRSTIAFDGEIETYDYRIVFERLLESSLIEAQSIDLISDTAMRVWA